MKRELLFHFDGIKKKKPITVSTMLLSEYTLRFILGDNIDESAKEYITQTTTDTKKYLPMWERLKSNIAVSSGLSCREYSTTFSN